MKNYINTVSNKVWLIAITVVISLIIAAACKNEPSNYKPRAIGSPGELLVVIEDDHWRSESGKLLKELLKDEFPALPQQELLFRKTRIAYNQFQNHFRTYRNVLLVSIRPDVEDTRVNFRRQQWARNQSVVEVVSPSLDNLGPLLQQKWPSIKGFFYNADIKAMAQSYTKVYQPEAVKHIEDNYPFSMYFPKGFKLKKSEGEFSWLDDQRMGCQLGVLVYRCPLDSIDQFNANALLQFRNNLLSQQVPGEYEGSYMSTEESFPVSVRKTEFANRNWTELRGLWKVQGDFMGGPFVDYFYEDKENNELLMLSGYIYAPSKALKGILVREIEAVLKTIEIKDI